MMILYKKLAYIAFSTIAVIAVNNTVQLEAFTDILSILMWVVGVGIMLSADYQDPKIKIARPGAYILFSVLVSTAICILVVILNIYKIFPLWAYYPLILAGSIFSPNIVRRFQKTVPGLADNALKTYAKKILDVQDDNLKENEDENNL